MKRLCKTFVFFLLLLVSSGAVAQKFYDEQWKKIEANVGKGTFKSNLPIVLDIQNQAMKDNNVLQLIRSLKAEFSIINQTGDQENNNAVSTFFAKIQTAGKQLKGKEKLLYDTLANEFFMNYYNNNSWRINGRTNLDTQDFSQIETWSRLAFKNYLLKNFAALDAQKKEMRQISMAAYKDLFPERADLAYFPTLSDWYGVQEIEFLSNSNLFTKNELTDNQKTINARYDGLIADNTGNAKLYFMHRKWLQNCSFSACKNRLEGLQDLLKSDVEGDYKVVIMQEIMQELIGRHKEKEALAVAEQAKSRYPKSIFLDNIRNSENQITNPYLQLKYEQEAQSKLPIQLVAEHKNISAFSLNIYEIKDILPFMQYLSNPYGGSVNKVPKKLVRKEDYTLPDLKDFHNHTTALEIKPLPSGMYMVEYTIPGDELKDKNQEKNFWFLVSDHKIIYQSKREDRGDSDVLKLVSSENGQPVKSEKLTFYEYAGNASFNTTNGNTGSDGTFRLPATKNGQYYRTFLIHQPATNDFQIMRSYGNNSPENNAEQKDHSMAQIFTDRAIYRPGQTVYFKVINTRIRKETESVVAGLKQKITLVDANDEDVSSQIFTTNEFGSYNGSFILPKGKLNGTFYLRTDGDQEGEKDFRVEEYKRPKFEVTFEPVKEEYQYGQTIMLKGKAMMFSGVPLSNTTVQYEIKKRDIRWRYFPWYDNGSNNENSVLGEAKTNDKGEFTIRVDLKKDEKREGVQIDNYEINASVTDINGETQSADTQLKVASVSHYIKADQINNVFAGENVKTKVETKNYNDQELKKAYRVNLSRLQGADRIFRNNFQAAVQDLPKLSKPEFISKFPHDFYDKNDEPKERKVSAVVLNGAEKNQQMLDLGPLQAGDYKLELYNIEGKDTIKTVQYFSVWDKKALNTGQKPFLSVVAPKGEFSRGGSAVIYAYSAVPDAQVNVFVQDGSGKTVSEVRQMKNGVLEYRVDIPKDKAVNELNIQFQVVAFNDIQTESVTLKIKDSEAPLKIETVTFRDKIEPGTKEKWSVKVTGSQKEKINAEVLANMYDMSLDQFASNRFDWRSMNVPFSIITSYTMNPNLQSEYYQKRMPYFNNRNVLVPDFNWFDGNLTNRSILNRLDGRVQGMVIRGVAAPAAVQKETAVEEVVVTGYSRKTATTAANTAVADSMSEEKNLDKVAVRQNLNETAFFYPDLKTDSEGNFSFEFTSPEALTKWKLMFLAHTKDARAATLEKEVVTQKEFSVTPNYPRFLREGDELNLQSRLSNLTDKKLNGSASLQILDAFTNEDVSSKFGINAGVQNFELAENGNAALTWKLKVPENIFSIIIKVVAKAGQYSDGEQQAVAVLPNRMLVTDAVPVFVKQGETKTFVLDQLKNTGSKTISNVSNTLELTTNPVWEIMFALPSMKNDLNNSADVVFDKWFADVLASEIFRANPKMKTIFEEYQNKGLLQSNLEKNQELKQLLLEETPWVLESSNEQEQMQKLALLFDANNMKNSTMQDWEELKNLQNPDGGFSWYTGYPSSYSVSLYILKNLGKINQWLKGNMKDYQDSAQNAMVAKLVQYADTEISKYANGVSSKDKVWNNLILDYLNTRNYWEQQYPLKGKGAELKTLVQQQAKTVKMADLTFFGLHRIALLMNSYGQKEVSAKLMNYLKETSTETKAQGTYWKQNVDDWGWFSSKVVNHAGAIEAFSLLKPQDQSFIEDLKIWLVTQKEVNSWGSSRATAEVIFTILNSGQSWTGTESNQATIVWGGKQIQPQTQATGYVKSTVKSDVLDKNLATVTVTKPGPGIVQGGLFWQYYEDLDKIRSSETYLSVSKKLYRKIKTVNGEELQPISAQTPLKTGDRVTVRMILNTDRPMEFIHIKDMRAAGFEPADVLSGYEWKNGLSYYQSTKDASTNFYIQAMPKGKYVFEYDVIANASGKFSNGITTIQNYYAPQMNAHTQGTKVTISE